MREGWMDEPPSTVDPNDPRHSPPHLRRPIRHVPPRGPSPFRSDGVPVLSARLPPQGRALDSRSFPEISIAIEIWIPRSRDLCGGRPWPFVLHDSTQARVSATRHRVPTRSIARVRRNWVPGSVQRTWRILRAAHGRWRGPGRSRSKAIRLDRDADTRSPRSREALQRTPCSCSSVRTKGRNDASRELAKGNPCGPPRDGKRVRKAWFHQLGRG
eukprot:scaffold856_cov326-Pavlova_lutheri.AAC.18